MSSPGKKISLRSKSPSRSNNRSESPSKAIRGRLSDSSLQELSKRKENLLHCFDIYELLFQNNAPQRCMTHNNFVTLYCENEHKLLCVNCIYGNSNHANHKVIPIKNAFKKIQDDNTIMKKHLKQYIEEIKLFQKNTLNIREQSEIDLESILNQLEDQYSKTLNTLQQKFMLMKESIVQIYKNDHSRIDVLFKQIQWMKGIYVERQKALPSLDEQSPLVFNHMMLNLMLDNDTLRQNRVQIIDANEIRNCTINQLKKVLDVIVNPNPMSCTKKRIY